MWAPKPTVYYLDLSPPDERERGTPMIRVAIVLGLVLLVGMACGDEPGAQVPAEATVKALVQQQVQQAPPGPTPSENPDLERTVEAIVEDQLAELDATVEALVEQRLVELLAATPASNPPYWPTAEDYTIALAMSGGKPDYENYAAVYVARECLAGRELTPEGFRALIRQGHRSVPGASDTLTQMINSAQGRIALGLPQAECMLPFTYPETLDDAMLSVSLYEAGWNVDNPVYHLIAPQYEKKAHRCFAQRSQNLGFLRCMFPGIFG